VVLQDLGNGPKALRDRAIVLLGFTGAFRRSELVSLDRADLEFVAEGVVVTLGHSKTDPVHGGRRLGIRPRTDGLCPVAALVAWLSASRNPEGPLFTRVDRHGRILPERLSPEAVSLVLKERVAARGYDPDKFSGHSLRAGFVTSAAKAGDASWKIRRQTGHASDAGLAPYIRDGQLFGDSAACAAN
jgi:integrase